ncbi:hypothetical protein AB0D35_33730, partial [Streptomyces sp. NPDC048301]|uniref:hypothetical protein n=1 Tax=Streptomyces sp. NPDC048301 TaxID=3155631 RepID=UPI003439A17F
GDLVRTVRTRGQRGLEAVRLPALGQVLLGLGAPGLEGCAAAGAPKVPPGPSGSPLRDGALRRVLAGDGLLDEGEHPVRHEAGGTDN